MVSTRLRIRVQVDWRRVAVPCTVQTLGVDVDPPCYTNIDYPWTAPPGLCFLPPRVPVPWRGQLARTA